MSRSTAREETEGLATYQGKQTEREVQATELGTFSPPPVEVGRPEYPQADQEVSLPRSGQPLRSDASMIWLKHLKPQSENRWGLR
jgi:hypothetical protein